MPTYIVTDANGKQIQAGDKITDFRGEEAIFNYVSRGPAYNGTAKIVTTAGRECYARVFGLTVRPENEQ
jgi:hypothetical protein